jgi:integrase
MGAVIGDLAVAVGDWTAAYAARNSRQPICRGRVCLARQRSGKSYSRSGRCLRYVAECIIRKALVPIASRRSMTLDEGIIEMLKHWRLQTQFASSEDWVFASPAQIGRLPVSYAWFLRIIQGTAMEAGIDGLGTHSFRHTYRSWLDAVGTPIAVQQKLMRHTDIRTTLNVYGDVVTNEMESANVKVADLALRKVIAN